MMQVQITSINFDPLGYLAFETLPASDDRSVSRRFSKVATTDGGVATTDRGFSHGDRELSYQYIRTSKEQDDIAARIFSIHSRVYVSNNEGLFECIPDSFATQDEENTVTFSVVSKISED